MAGELKVLRAEAGANAADPVLKQAAPATTAESTTARCAQEREQANCGRRCEARGAGGPVTVAEETGRAGGSVLARAAGHMGWHRRQRLPTCGVEYVAWLLCVDLA
jgi:membrane protease subunit (stomatin/prohibitin family)